VRKSDYAYTTHAHPRITINLINLRFGSKAFTFINSIFGSKVFTSFFYSRCFSNPLPYFSLWPQPTPSLPAVVFRYVYTSKNYPLLLYFSTCFLKSLYLRLVLSSLPGECTQMYLSRSTSIERGYH
jgi:hypothetical protein